MSEPGISRRELLAAVGRDDPVVLDVGCNDGTHTRWFLELFPRASVFCFEPDRRARRRFAANVEDPRVQLFAVAISDRDGSAELHLSGGVRTPESAAQMPDGWDRSSSIRRPLKHLEVYPWCTFERKERVPTRGLDSWSREHGVGAVDLIWADVQGAESELIRGGRETLARSRYFYTECHGVELYQGQPDLDELLAALPDFELVRRYPKDVLLANRRLASVGYEPRRGESR